MSSALDPIQSTDTNNGTNAPEPNGHNRHDQSTPQASTGPTTPAGHEQATRPPSRWLAALRLSVGFIFLWAFLDKLFGLGYATPSENAWLEGGSPTFGYLSNVAVGPMETTFHSWAGQGWVDWLFMAGLAGIGLAVTLGIGLRAAAVGGSLMMLFMWVADWPLAQNTSAGDPTMSSNPLVDYHIIYAVALIVVAATYAGDRWGLGRAWARQPLVRQYEQVLR